MGATCTYGHPSGALTMYATEDALGAPPRMAWLHPAEGPVNISRVEFAYSGGEGVHQMRLGRRTQLMTVDVVAIAVSEVDIEGLVSPWRERQDGQVGTLVLRGVTTHKFCELYAADFDNHFRTFGNVFLLYGRLTFRKIGPNSAAKWGGS